MSDFGSKYVIPSVSQLGICLRVTMMHVYAIARSLIMPVRFFGQKLLLLLLLEIIVRIV